METQLIDGSYIQLDEQDLPLLSLVPWRRYESQGKVRILSSTHAVARHGRRYMSLARLIVSAPPSVPVGFKNSNPLDLRRDNLTLGLTLSEPTPARVTPRRIIRPVGVLHTPRLAQRAELGEEGSPDVPHIPSVPKDKVLPETKDDVPKKVRRLRAVGTTRW